MSARWTGRDAVTLKAAFMHDMLRSAHECKRESGSNPTYWLRMLGELGAVAAAK